MGWFFDPDDMDLGDLDLIDLTIPPGDGDTLVWDDDLGAFVPGPAATPINVRDAGRWEVVVAGVPAEAVTNETEDDWLYAWAGA